MDGDIEIIETESHHEPDQAHDQQWSEETLGVEVVSVVGVSLPGQGEVAGHRHIVGHQTQVMITGHRWQQLNLDNVAGVGQHKQLEEWMKTADNVHI